MTRRWIAWGSVSALHSAGHLRAPRFTRTRSTRSSVQWARPDDVWGAAQLRADIVVEGSAPDSSSPRSWSAFTAVCCVKRRSLRPAAFVGAVCLATVALTSQRRSLRSAVRSPWISRQHGGSFPSGHMIALMVVVGLAVLMARPRAGRWVWLVASSGWRSHGGLPAAPGGALVDRHRRREPARRPRAVRRDCLPLDVFGCTIAREMTTNPRASTVRSVVIAYTGGAVRNDSKAR